MINTSQENIVVVVQARTSSERLPGKVLKKLAGKPMIGHLLENLKHCKTTDKVVLTTSQEASDDKLASYAGSIGISCYRGPLNQVAERVLSAAKHHKADAIVRVSGDSPFMDYRLIDKAVEIYRSNTVDLVTNVAIRTFPKGQSVEVIKVETLERMISDEISARENEHVTPKFYDQDSTYKIVNFENVPPCGDIQLSIDTPDELKLSEKIFKRMDHPYSKYCLKDILVLRQKALEEENATA
ncbi:cytidylyltransferase domain-containing protein [Kiloniella majae]|uniref:cytidylyltransferase domain-containing protein n=1 Tax=Kiloniella majae TaxID=1938558 RepID=UPI000A278290|nr:NTP transferase domain-containing protein [Kiloniella majae]